MTNNTNNQEWWELEFDEAAKGCKEVIKLQPYPIPNSHKGQCYWCGHNPERMKDFIRKVSHKSREDALKEIYEEFDKEWRRRMDAGTMVTAYLVCADTVRAILKSKLSS